MADEPLSNEFLDEAYNAIQHFIAVEGDTESAGIMTKDIVAAYVRRDAKHGRPAAALVEEILRELVVCAPGYANSNLKVISPRSVLFPKVEEETIEAQLKDFVTDRKRGAKLVVDSSTQSLDEPKDIRASEATAPESEDDSIAGSDDGDDEADGTYGDDIDTPMDDMDENTTTEATPAGTEKKTVTRSSTTAADKKQSDTTKQPAARGTTAADKKQSDTTKQPAATGTTAADKRQSDTTKQPAATRQTSGGVVAAQAGKPEQSLVAVQAAKPKQGLGVVRLIEPHGVMKDYQRHTPLHMSSTLRVTMGDIHKEIMADKTLSDYYMEASDSHQQKISSLLILVEYMWSWDNLERIRSLLRDIANVGAVEEKAAHAREGEPPALHEAAELGASIIQEHRSELLGGLLYWTSCAKLAKVHRQIMDAIRNDTDYGKEIVEFLRNNPELYSHTGKWESRAHDYILRAASNNLGQDQGDDYDHKKKLLTTELEVGRVLRLMEDAFGGRMVFVLIPPKVKQFLRTLNHDIVATYTQKIVERHPQVAQIGFSLQNNLLQPFFNGIDPTAMVWAHVYQNREASKTATWEELAAPNPQAIADAHAQVQEVEDRRATSDAMDTDG